ncbi:hypothetical protein V7056_06690 [Bacillus sp. JJ664]
MLKRIIVASVAAIIFSLIFSFLDYVPVSQRINGTYYFGFFETFIIILIYSSPIYFVAGIPLSIGIEYWHQKYSFNSKYTSYIVKVGMYSIVGMIVGALFYILISQGVSKILYSQVFEYILLGLIASNVFYHLLLLMNINHGTKDSEITSVK